MKRIVAITVFLVMLACGFARPLSARAQEPEQKVVRVGWFESTFCYKDQYGRRCGIDYEYQHKISAYTGWTFEYVEDSWSNLLQRLIAGEIDLLSDVSYTEERTELISFPDLPMGSESYYIYIDADNREITADNLASLNGKRIGVNRGSVQEGYIKEWAVKNGIGLEVVPLATEEADSMAMLAQGRVDGYTSTNTFGAKQKVIPVCKVGSSDFFYAVSKSRPDLLAELNMALTAIQDEDPGFNDRLYAEHIHSTKTNAFLTPAQDDWLQQHGAIRIGYRDDFLPFCDHDRETGEVTGALKDFIAHAENSLPNSEIRFETVPYATVETALKALEAGEVDCVFPVDINSYDADQMGVRLTNSAMKTEMQAIIRASEQQGIDWAGSTSFAVVAGDVNIETFIKGHYPNARIIYCPDRAKCYDAVSSGNADCLLLSNYQLQGLEDTLKKYRLFSVPTGETMPLSFAVGRGERELYFILNKTVILAANEDMDSALASYISKGGRTSFARFFEDNWLAVVISIAVIAAVIILLLYRNMKAERRAKELEEATKIKELKRSITLLLDNLPGLNFTKDANTGIYLMCNQAFADFVRKKKPAAVVGLTDEELFDPDTARHFAEDDRRALLMDEPYSFFEEVRDADGNRRHFQTTKMKYVDSEGRQCLFGFSQEASDT